ncbi:hypothetical protein [Bdellovibrio svalbardensis]|uniref:IPT/TIG domain-containing protein n=1 Tax=Bdellovibrio svalbardensis TaxID=2972972 RepID=A0ABT6DGE8_9BACT|nr:hypothetical protein [Bdellovibrio svalbardensis]MDG0815552.1 hypothetical protein [Bdellovibrio svalbardensis]
MQTGFLFNKRGSTLPLALGLVVLASIFCVSYSNSIVNMQSRVSYANHRFSRQFSINQILTFLKTPNSLTESSGLSLNSNLASCLFGTTTSTCTENCCNAGNEDGFYFIDPSDSNSDLNLKARLIGPPTAPVWYKANNTQCPANTVDLSDCSYSLSGTYTAVCPGNETTCHHAEHLIATVHLVANPNTKVKGQNIKDQNFTLIYFNNINYPPSVLPVPDITLSLASATETEVSITGYSGHPSEVQNFIFEKCQSSNSSVVQVTTPPDTPFSSGTAKIKLKPTGIGSAKVALQINDGGLENNLSKEAFFNVTVTP